MGLKREVRCQEFDVNTCTIVHASRGEKKKHDRQYHSKNSAVGSREGFHDVVITRDFSKSPPYYYCTGIGCKTMTNRLPSMKDHIPKCKFIQWSVAPSTTASTLASPQPVPTASQSPSKSHQPQPTGTTKRKATDMASSEPSSALPPAGIDAFMSLFRSVSPAPYQTSVFQSLATQLELYMKSTDTALVNSQTALVNSQTAFVNSQTALVNSRTTLERSQIALQQSKVAIQQITTSIATLEKKIDGLLTTTTAYQADINAKCENLTDQLALQATRQLAIQDTITRVLGDIRVELAKKNDDAIARNNDVLRAISQQRADRQETTRRLEDRMSLANVPLSCDFSESGKTPSLTVENLKRQYNDIGDDDSKRLTYLLGKNPSSKKVKFATFSHTSGSSSSYSSGSRLSTSINRIHLPDDDDSDKHIQ
ncbi:MAG: hypothetical protein J3R72DRAFT_522864 [Linnemannia gamsii]|nr:MAG: hypothetical protein J3R72DRAFT_522864 [Linnemannia gamsii]